MPSPSAEDLFAAISADDAGTVRALLAADSSLAESRRRDGLSAVLFATYVGAIASLPELLTVGPTLDVFEAAAVGATDRLTELLAADPGLAIAYASDGFTALGLASFFGRAETARRLLGAGADPNAASRNSMRVTPLHSAVAAQATAIASDLIAAGADVNAVQADGFTPLHESAQNGDVATTEVLLAAGADRTARKDDGETPADTARAAGHVELAARLAPA